jgi:site-specific DNA-methyltransferase (adenine-specific)
MRLYQGDCLEIMQQLEDKSVDMVLCDLPYGCTRNKWDAIIPMGPLWEQYERIAKDNAAIVLFSNPPFTAQLILSNLKLYRYEIIWAKPQGTDFLNANRKPLKAHENIEVFYKHLPYYNRKGRMGKPYRSMTGRTSENWGGTRESLQKTATGGAATRRCTMRRHLEAATIRPRNRQNCSRGWSGCIRGQAKSCSTTAWAVARLASRASRRGVTLSVSSGTASILR